MLHQIYRRFEDAVACISSGSVNVRRGVCFDYLALSVDALHSTETFVTFYQFRRRNNPEHLNLQFYGYLNEGKFRGSWCELT
jgi:hypothetical protein